MPSTQLRIQLPSVHIHSPSPRDLDIGLDICLTPGSVLILRGRSGSGKSLSLRWISGRTDAIDGNSHIAYPGALLQYSGDSGSLISFEGRPDIAQSVPQELDEFFVAASVATEVELALELSGASEAAMRRRTLLNRLGVSDTTFATLHRISYGQRHLVALASALAWSPQVLVLDEPFAALSGTFLQRAVQQLNSYLASGGIVIISSHVSDLGLTPSAGAELYTHEMPCSTTLPENPGTDEPQEPGFGHGPDQETVLYVIPGGDLHGRDDSRFLFSYDSIKIRKGDCILLEGPVGCGKTTFIEHIVGVNGDWPEDAEFAGHAVSERPPAYPDDVGYCSATSLCQLFAGRVASVLQAAPRNSSTLRQAHEDMTRQLSAILAKADVHEDAFVTDLSYGQQRLVVMARYGNIPRLLAIDELPHFIDPVQQRLVRSIMDFYLHSGCTLLITSHRPDVARQYCNRQLLVANGWLQDVPLSAGAQR